MESPELVLGGGYERTAPGEPVEDAKQASRRRSDAFHLRPMRYKLIHSQPI